MSRGPPRCPPRPGCWQDSHCEEAHSQPILPSRGRRPGRASGSGWGRGSGTPGWFVLKLTELQLVLPPEKSQVPAQGGAEGTVSTAPLRSKTPRRRDTATAPVTATALQRGSAGVATPLRLPLCSRLLGSAPKPTVQDPEEEVTQGWGWRSADRPARVTQPNVPALSPPVSTSTNRRWQCRYHSDSRHLGDVGLRLSAGNRTGLLEVMGSSPVPSRCLSHART